MAENCQVDTFAQGVWFLRTSFVLLLAALGQHSELLLNSKKNKPLETAEILQVQEAKAITGGSKAAEPAAPSIDEENQAIAFADRTPAVLRTRMVATGTALRVHAQWPLQEFSSSPQGPEKVHDIRGNYGVSCQSVHPRRSLPVN